MKKYKFIGNEGYSNNLGGNYFTPGQITDYEPLVKRFPEFFEEVIQVENVVAEKLDDETDSNLNETKDDNTNVQDDENLDNEDAMTDEDNSDEQLDEAKVDEKPAAKEVVGKVAKPKANKSNKNKK